MKTKDEKREQALARQAAHDKLSIKEKLDKIKTRPGESRRERLRLVQKVGAK